MEVTLAILGLTVIGTLTGCIGLGYLVYGVVSNPVSRNLRTEDVTVLAEASATKILTILEKLLNGEIKGPDCKNLIEVLVERIDEHNTKIAGNSGDSEN
jgi:hypothetical protein